MTSRRAFLFGAAATLAAPAVVPFSSLMKLWVPPTPEIITLDETVFNIMLPQHAPIGTVLRIMTDGRALVKLGPWAELGGNAYVRLAQ